jgi:hypothetical protein
MNAKLWIVGCSITHGIGVNTEQRWGEIIGKQLGITPTFLTAEGSSIEWSANQILQADINKDDTVCWGLTTPNRSLWYNDCGEEQHILNVYYQNRPKFQDILNCRHLVDLNLAYKAVNYVKQVQNHLGKIGCYYVIGSILPGLDEHRKILIEHLEASANFYIMYNITRIKYIDPATFLKLSKPLNNLFDDVGSDGFHPGPKQHQVYAEQFLTAIGNLN